MNQILSIYSQTSDAKHYLPLSTFNDKLKCISDSFKSGAPSSELLKPEQTETFQSSSQPRLSQANLQ